VPSIGKLDGRSTELVMTCYIAIIEDAGPDKAAGVWFPDLPGCFSAGDTIDEALVNAPEAVLLYAEALEGSGRTLPRPRTLSDLKADERVATDIRQNMVALIALQERIQPAE
jgi:predicted RNase H-like HicB family nuclease